MKKLTILLALLASSIESFAIGQMGLSGEWKLSAADGCIPAGLPVAVPGDVHSALLEAGLIKDPYYAFKEMENLWVGRCDWIISRTFIVDESFLRHAAIYLRAEDVDTFSDITINGHKVGSTTNRFRRREWDVKPYLVAGENVIEGFFHSAENIMDCLTFLQ